MSTRVVNLYREKPDVYIGRASSAAKVRARHGDLPGLDGRFGNPYSVAQHGDRAFELFEAWFAEKIKLSPRFRADVLHLRGKKLGCFCKPRLCHGDRLAAWIDSQPEASCSP